MANWKLQLDLSDVWDSVNEDEEKVPAFCLTVAERLEKLLEETDGLTPTIQRGLRQYADEFRDLGEDADFVSFNYIWNYFYDWADIDHRLFVRTW